MKILVVSQYYYPEPFRVSDYCEELVKRGHAVTVVTGTPNYPMGDIYEGYENGQKKDEIIKGVSVHRCQIVGRKTGSFNRFLNYYDFVIKSKEYIRRLDGSYDVVLVNQLSPVMMAEAGILYKKKNKKKLLLYCLDIWPESLIVGGIKRNSIIYKLFNKLSKKIYSNADVILNSSKSFDVYFEKQFGIVNTGYLPQYAEDLFNPKSCYKTPNGFVDILFAGNIGIAQSVKTIIEAARLTIDYTYIQWHIVGDGSELGNLIKMAEGLDNIHFYGKKSIEEMPSFYSLADVMLVTMENNPILSCTLPGKIQSYMAAGKAIIGAINGETARIINDARCGQTCNSEDSQGLAKIALSFNPQDNLGLNARNYYEIHFAKQKFIESLEQQLEKLI